MCRGPIFDFLVFLKKKKRKNPKNTTRAVCPCAFFCVSATHAGRTANSSSIKDSITHGWWLALLHPPREQTPLYMPSGAFYSPTPGPPKTLTAFLSPSPDNNHPSGRKHHRSVEEGIRMLSAQETKATAPPPVHKKNANQNTKRAKEAGALRNARLCGIYRTFFPPPLLKGGMGGQALNSRHGEITKRQPAPDGFD